MTDAPNIIRTPHNSERPYFSMARSSAQDRRLSWEARGVLAYLLSKPDDWKVMIVDLQQGCGRDKAKAIIAELLAFGYITIANAKPDGKQAQDKKGHFAPNEYRVHEVPFTENPLTVNPSTVDPLTVNPQLHSIEEQSIDVLSTDDTLSPSGDAGDAKVKAPRKRDDLFDAIAVVWNTEAAGWIVKVKSMMNGTAKSGEWKECAINPAATPDEIMAFGDWCKAHKFLKGTVPTVPSTLQRYFYEFRKAKRPAPSPNVIELNPAAPLASDNIEEAFQKWQQQQSA